jgi:hypothetical protein
MKTTLLTFFFALTAIACVHAQCTSQDAGNIATPAPTAAAPIWAKLVVASNTVTCYYAKGVAAPTTWTQIGKPEAINFVNNPVLVGMYLCSDSPTALCSGTIDNFSITPAPTYRLADADIGAPALMGSANLINGVWNLSGCGTDIWNASDQFNFQPWLVWGDCTIVARITSIGAGDGWQKIGIMVRDGYNSGSDYAMFCATGGAGVDFQWRRSFNNNPDATQLVAPAAPGATTNIAVGYSLTGPTAYVVRP